MTLKCLDSEKTTLTKTSLLHHSSQNFQKQTFVKVFFTHQQRLRAVTIPLNPITVKELIEEALQELNFQWSMDLLMETEKWILYASKRNGNKYSDLPSLDPTQKVDKTGFMHFLLLPERSSPRKRVSGCRIKTQFYPEKKSQIKPKETKSCLCFHI